MGLMSKTTTALFAAAGIATFSQAPEFAQQYRQRIGGAVDELKTVVTDFDRDAANSNLSRDDALSRMKTSSERFTRDRGNSMDKTINRYDALRQQQGWLENAHPFSMPLLVARNPDRQLITNAWQAFKPAMPFTVVGLTWAGIGAVLAMLLARLGIGTVRIGVSGAKAVGKVGNRRRKSNKPQKADPTDEIKQNIDHGVEAIEEKSKDSDVLSTVQSGSQISQPTTTATDHKAASSANIGETGAPSVAIHPATPKAAGYLRQKNGERHVFFGSKRTIKPKVE